METRYLKIEDLEGNDAERRISGYAIVFNTRSEVLGGPDGFQEVILPSALDDLDLSDVHLYYQHSDKDILANSRSGTLTLTRTGKGLHFSAELPDTNLGRDTYTLIKRGDLNAMSFGFTVDTNGQDWDTRHSPEVRKIKKISRLFEISIVSRPAYKDSHVEARTLEFLNDCRECRTDLHPTNPLLEEAKQLINNIKDIQDV